MPAPEPCLKAFVDGDSVVLVKREGGARVLERRRAEWVSYFRAPDLDDELERALRSSQHVASLRPEGEFLRVGWRSRWAREQYCVSRESPLRARGVEALEADVGPVERMLADGLIEPTSPRRCYLDLETDSRLPFSKKKEMRVLVWTVRPADGSPASVGVLKADTDADERELLDEMWRVLAAYDQVAAWNGDSFDFEVIPARTERCGIRVDTREWLWVDHLACYERMNKNSAESGEEKSSLKLEDVAQARLGEGKTETPDFVRSRWPDRSRRGLGAITWELWEAGGEFRRLLALYCLQDTDLLPRIEEDTGYLDLFGTLCEACHIFADSASLNPTHQVDGFMLRLGRERGMRFKSKRYYDPARTTDQFKGAYVLQPRTLEPDWREKMGMADGILHDVHVFDFASLYPSIILTFNMSPETRRPDVPVNGPVPPGICRAPTGAGFTTEVAGILPTALREGMRLRKYWSDRQASLPPGTEEYRYAARMSMAYKVFNNSFYGVVSSPWSRYYDRVVGESITQAGVWLLKMTLHEAEVRGMIPVAGDTDSGFLYNASIPKCDEFVAWCNEELYPAKLRALGCTENAIKVAYEKAYERICFTAAKRYIGRFAHFKGTTTCPKCKKKNGDPGAVDVRKLECRDCGAKFDNPPRHTGKFEVKGLEYKRGDASRCARRMQEEAIELLVGENPSRDPAAFESLVTTVRAHVLEDGLDLEDFVLSKALSKPLRDYVAKDKADGTPAAQPPHVVVARELESRGREVLEGTRIEYVVVDGSRSPIRAIPAEDYAGEFDRHYLWENLTYPPTQRLLEAALPQRDWAGWGVSRPPKPRAKRSKALAGQMTLAATGAESAVKVTAEVRAGASPPGVARAPARRKAVGEPLRLVVADGATEGDLEALHAVLSRHPGARRVELVLLTGAGEAVLATAARVEPTDAMFEELPACVVGYEDPAEPAA